MVNKKERNRNQQYYDILKQEEEDYRYIRELSDQQKEWLLYCMLGGKHSEVGYVQVKGKLYEFLQLLKMFMEYHRLLTSEPEVKGSPEHIIWKDSLKEAPIAFREDIYEWVTKYFPKSLKFDLETVLRKNEKHILDENGFQTLVGFSRKIAKKLETEEAKEFYQDEKIKSIGDKWMMV